MSTAPDQHTTVFSIFALALAGVGSWGAVQFNWFERFCLLVRAYDAYQLDELLIIGLLFAAAGLLMLLKRQRGLLRSLARVVVAKDAALAAARLDYLTRLPNRLALTEAVHTSARPFGLLLIDLDGFKKINDSGGHLAGDQVLVEVACRLDDVGKSAGASLVARLGGDEFACLLPLTCADDPELLARRIIDAISQPVGITGGFAKVTPSVGIAVAESSDCSFEDMLNRADGAMYAAKSGGGAQYATSPRSMAHAA